MTPPTVLVSKPVNSAMPWSSWTTGVPARRSVKLVSAARPGARSGGLDAAAAQQAVVGHDRELQRRRDEPLAQRGGGEVDARLARRDTVPVGGGDRPRSLVEELRADAGEVVGGALGLAAAGPRDDGSVAGADQLLELRLGRLERARGGLGGLGAELCG